MFTRSDGLSRFPVLLVLVLATTVTWILTGGDPKTVVTASEVHACREKTAVYYEMCMSEVRSRADLPDLEDEDGDTGDIIESRLTNPFKIMNVCKAKLDTANCLITKLCSSSACTINQIKAAEEQLVKELSPFKTPCKWSDQELQALRCSQDFWNLGHGISTTANNTEVILKRGQDISTSSNSTETPTKNSTAAFVSESNTFNSTATSKNSTAVSNSEGSTFNGTFNGTAASAKMSTAVSYSNESTFSGTGTPTHSGMYSIFKGLHHKVLILFAASCLIALLITSLYFCICACIQRT